MRRGFTLVEVLIALAIFALLTAGALGVLRSALSARDAAGERLARSAEVARLHAALAADLGQTVARRTRGREGEERAIAFQLAAPTGEVFLTLVRAGWENPDAAPRPSLQYVEYRWREGRIERVVASRLDGGELQEPQVIARGVESLSVRAFGENAWRAEWRARPGEPLPGAVEVAVELQGLGRVAMFLMVTGER